MKKILLFLLPFFFHQNFVLGITPSDDFNNILYSYLCGRFHETEDTPLVEKARDFLRNNPKYLEDEIFFAKPPNKFAKVGVNAFTELWSLCYKGFITKEHFFDITMKKIKNIKVYSISAKSEDDLAFYLGRIVNFAYFRQWKERYLSISENFSCFPLCVNSMLKYGLLTDEIFSEFLLKIISSANQNIETEKNQGKEKASVTIQNALRAIENNKEKCMSEAGYKILNGYLKNLLAQIQQEL